MESEKNMADKDKIAKTINYINKKIKSLEQIHERGDHMTVYELKLIQNILLGK
jgi:hypothetical protein